MPREIATYPISSSIKQKLFRAGYTYDSCVKNCTPLQLCKEASLSKEEALDVLKLLRRDENKITDMKQYAASSLALIEQSTSSIVTFSQKIDNMFGDGIPVGKITEICGVPGVGKTQMSMQLCVDSTIPECFGGVQGQAIYIDTEGSFVAERITQIGTATVNHCHLVANSTNDPEMQSELENFTLESIMKSIHYFRCNSCIELVALAQQIPQFIKEKCNNKVKLVVVDSFAFHFRHDWDDMSSRTRIMGSLAQQLMKVASTSRLAIVLVNQMTTKVSGSEGTVVPALGESWSHAATNRVLLFWRDGVRYANLFKSPNRKEDTVPYCVTAEGIRDILDDTDDRGPDENEKPAKRTKLS